MYRIAALSWNVTTAKTAKERNTYGDLNVPHTYVQSGAWYTTYIRTIDKADTNPSPPPRRIHFFALGSEFYLDFIDNGQGSQVNAKRCIINRSVEISHGFSTSSFRRSQSTRSARIEIYEIFSNLNEIFSNLNEIILNAWFSLRVPPFPSFGKKNRCEVHPQGVCVTAVRVTLLLVLLVIPRHLSGGAGWIWFGPTDERSEGETKKTRDTKSFELWEEEGRRKGCLLFLTIENVEFVGRYGRQST